MGDWIIILVILGIITGLGLLLAALVLFAVYPATRKHPERKNLEGIYIAHRGLHDVSYKGSEKYPENSLSAFKLAAENGFAMENDIHLTKDGQVVVFHDDSLKRMCGVDGRPEDFTLEELKKLRLKGTDEQIPTLVEHLEAVAGKTPILIEFKTHDSTYVQLCEKANEILEKYKGTYWIQSFYPKVLMWYRKNRPDVMRGQLATSNKGKGFVKVMMGNLMFNFLARPDFVSYDFRCADGFFPKLCTKLGAFPVNWTIRSEEELEKCKKTCRAYIFELFIKG